MVKNKKENQIQMKKMFGTILSICIVTALIIMSIVFGRTGFTQEQVSTFWVLLIVCGFSIAYCFIVGEITHNYSQMDKLWSILPIAYLWIIAAHGKMSLRLVMYAIIGTVWGVRLTINFARKGAYRLKFWEGNEDYRWSIVRSHPVFKHSFLWTLFNLFFISAYQNLLVLAICLPALACMGSTEPIGLFDIIAASMAVFFLLLETVSDEYQWKFHKEKNRMLAEGRVLGELPAPYDLGFNTTGPWGYMRHPNYLGEQGIWVSMYLFVLGAGAVEQGIFNITLVGPLLLVLLFMGSSMLGEKISSGKYPKYEDYIRQVNKYIPIHRFDAGGSNTI